MHGNAWHHFTKWHHDIMKLWHSKNMFFQWIFSLFFVFAPTASILNQFSQTRYHFKAENLLFPTIINHDDSHKDSCWFALIHTIGMCKSELARISENHWELVTILRISENQFLTDLRISENHQESISQLFENWQESVRIIKNQWESLRIT